MTSSLVTNIQGRLPIGGEFQGKNGDCNEYSFMVARCAAQPSHPCDAAELNRLTQEAIDNGQAAASGAMTPSNLAWLCNKEGVGYAQVVGTGVLPLVQQWGGTQAIVYTCTNGAALPGNEQGVQGHAIAVLDYAGGVFTVANGDSTNGRAGKLDTVSQAQIQASQPYSATRLELSVNGPYTPFYTTDSPTQWHVTAHPEIIVKDAELTFYNNNINQAPGVALSALNYGLQNKYGKGFAVRLYERSFMVYDPGHAYDNPPQQFGGWYLAKVTSPEFAALFGILPPAQAAFLTLNGTAHTVSKVDITYA